MKVPYKSTALAAALTALVAMPMAWADNEVAEVTSDTTDVEVIEIAERVPGDRIAGFFTDFFGDDSQSVVAGLRDGSIQYVEPTPESDVEAGGEEVATVESGSADNTPEMEDGENTNTGMGYGNVLITMALAEQMASSSQAAAIDGEEGMTTQESLNEILRMRQVDGMGWGKIAKTMGINLGEVMSGIHSNRQDRAAHTERSEKREVARAEKLEMREMARAERLAKLERPEKPARPEKAERPEKPARPERPGK